MDKLYYVYNETTSPVCISTRNDSITIPAAENGQAASYPLSCDEISYVNNTSNAFKIGLLKFADDEAEELYDFIRIRNWRDILCNAEIERILVSPTADGLQKILDITNEAYFGRVYGIYIGLKSTGIAISGDVDRIMKARHDEFKKNIRTSKIKVSVTENATAEKDNEIEALKAQIEELKKALTPPVVNTTAGSESKTKEDTKPAAPKKRTAARNSKTTK